MTKICWLSVPSPEVLGGQPTCGLSHTYIPSTRTAPACGGAQCVKEGGGEGAGQTRGPFHRLSLSSATKAQVGKHIERTWKVVWGESLTMKKISKWKKTWRSMSKGREGRKHRNRYSCPSEACLAHLVQPLSQLPVLQEEHLRM